MENKLEFLMNLQLINSLLKSMDYLIIIQELLAGILTLALFLVHVDNYFLQIALDILDGLGQWFGLIRKKICQWLHLIIGFILRHLMIIRGLILGGEII
jgi:hypothetical protein